MAVGDEMDNGSNEAFEAAFELSQLLNTGLDREALRILIKLCEQGINPEALASVVKELRAEAQKPPSGGHASRR